MLLIDNNEARNQPALVALLRQHTDVDVGDYNLSPNQSLIYPDFTISGGELMCGWNRKTYAEVLGGIDKVELQLQRELAGPVEYLCLGIEGFIRPSPTGTWAYQIDWRTEHYYSAARLAGTVGWKRQLFHISYKAVRAWEQRLSQLGVAVYHCADTEDTAEQLIALHDLVMKGGDHRTLNRLIKMHYQVQGLTQQETRFARTLMGIEGAQWGEELALTLAKSFGSVTELIRYWDDGGTIADTVLRSGTRRIGVAAERKLQEGLGYARVEAASHPDLNPV